ncbi:Uncharacterised protein [Bordetella pertussis]|nr:Uncharacterised protein [Bordetella pertussis]CFP67696.1 Uncharacterised protein [Bordetella pertussis]CFT93206.1 Uncharacterised protein [Bordetella pertussis]CFW00155.1 Uncharacterised protein [Bordetella pertussis]CFW39378.1 Uncharacterised protein [Bordetella pertussis]
MRPLSVSSARPYRCRCSESSSDTTSIVWNTSPLRRAALPWTTVRASIWRNVPKPAREPSSVRSKNTLCSSPYTPAITAQVV